MRKEDRAGIELTIIIHLVVLIILLLVGIAREISIENSFVLDFTKQEELERELQSAELREKLNKRLDDMIAGANAENPVRNVAVSSELRDDRNSREDARKLYEEAKRLEKDLKNGYKADIEEEARNEAVDYTGAKEDSKAEYSGPSVLSWTLSGRKASHLPIPAYRCYGSGQVSVAIVVDQQGKVVNAKINEAVSSEDDCLRNFAVRAARMSRFSVSTSAPTRQAGEIVYEFIAQ